MTSSPSERLKNEILLTDDYLRADGLSGARGSSYEGTPPPRQPAVDERRVALVVGNGAYSHAEPLSNPVNDAKAMAAVLAKLGFDVVSGLDLDLRTIGDVQGAFEKKLRTKPDVALLFYAGHGLQVDGRNYLVPIDAEITQKAHLASRALLFNDILDDMAREASASLVFLDACRDNPFTRSLARAMGDSARFAGVRGGLARLEKIAGTFIAFATAPDQIAFDGKGTNSPFTSALLDHIETPGLSVVDLMIDVRNKVLAETDGRQEPWDQSSLRAKFYFVPPAKEALQPIPEAVTKTQNEIGASDASGLQATHARRPADYQSNPDTNTSFLRRSEIVSSQVFKTGIFRAEIFDMTKGITQIEDIVWVTKRRKGYSVTPLYVRDKQFDYIVLLDSMRTPILEGKWWHIKNNVYRGYAMIRQYGDDYHGYMLGNTGTNQPNVLRWSLHYTGLKSFNRFNLRGRFKTKFHDITMTERRKQKNAISRIVHAHEQNPDDVYEYKGTKLRIDRGICNPKHSTFSVVLLEEALKQSSSLTSVLDVGCGSGLYAIHLKRAGAQTVVATDFQRVLQTARANAVSNLGENHGIDFRISQSDEVFMPVSRAERFDLILANLPFAPRRWNPGFKTSLYFKSFSANDALLFNFVIGCRLHLHQQGAAYFVFGETGDDDFMRTLIELSGLEVQIAKFFPSPFSGRRHNIYRLSRPRLNR